MSDAKEVPYYVRVLANDFAERKRKNFRYSLRAYAKLFGINSGSLSLILEGRRKIPSQLCVSICQKLDLNGAQRTRFIESACPQKKQSKESDQAYLNIIAELDEKSFKKLTKFLGKLQIEVSKTDTQSDNDQIYKVSLFAYPQKRPVGK